LSEIGISLSVMIAAKDEEQTVREVLLAHLEVLKTLESEIIFEIGILDDGSTDDTLKLIREVKRQHPEVMVWNNSVPSGIAGAFAQLAHHANHQWLYITSADGQFSSECLRILINSWKKDLVTTLGVRTTRKQAYSLRRNLISNVYRIVTTKVFGIDLVDPGSVKIIRTQVAKADLLSKSTMRDAEQLAIAYRQDGKINFVEIPFKPRSKGKASGASIPNLVSNLNDALTIYRRRFN